MESNRNDATEKYSTPPQMTSDAVDFGIELTVVEDPRFGKKLSEIGNFKLIKEIGRGGMGIVYEAIQKDLGRTVAVKILPSAKSDGSSLIRFQNEANAAAKLSHDNIVPILTFDTQDGLHYFSMKLIRGVNFSELLKGIRTNVESFNSDTHRVSRYGSTSISTPAAGTSIWSDSFSSAFKCDFQHSASSTRQVVRTVAAIGAKVADALDHAHQRGVIHRDIKPSNLMLDDQGKVWVMDFGLALIEGEPTVTRSGDLVGTLRYMSPEQAAGARAFVDHRTDVYSLGVTLYELATLQTACRGTNRREIFHAITFERPSALRRVNPHVPKEFEKIIQKATERNPEDRYHTAMEMAVDLERFLQGEPLLARPVKVLKRLQNWFFEHPVSTLSVGICLLVTLFASTIAAGVFFRGQTIEHHLLTLSESKRALLHSNATRDENPGLAVAWAIKGAAGSPGIESDRTLLAALDGLHEEKSLQLTESFVGKLTSSHDGATLIRTRSGEFFGEGVSAIELIDWQTGKARKLESSGTITSARMSENGKLLLTASSSFSRSNMYSSLDQIQFGLVQVWDPNARMSIKEFPDARQLYCRPDSFSADGKQLILSTKDGSATVYDTTDWSISIVLRPPQGEVLQAGCNRRGDRFATWDTSGKLIIWDGNGAPKDSFDYSSSNPLMTNFEFSANSSNIVLYGRSGTKCFDFTVEKPEPILSLPASFAKFSPKGDILCVANVAAGRFQLIRLPSGQPIADQFTSNSIKALEFTPDGESVLAACGQEIEIYDALTGELRSRCKGHQSPIENLVVGSAGRFFSLDWDGSLRVWNVLSNRQKRTIPFQLNPQAKLIIDHSADGKFVLLGTIARAETKVLNLKNPADRFTKIAGLSQSNIGDTNQILTHVEHELMVWDPRTLRELAKLTIPKETIQSFRHSELKSVAVIRTRSGALFLWNYTTQSVTTLTQVGENAYSYDISPDGKFVCIGLGNGALIQFDIDEEKRLYERGLAESISSVEFNAIGDKVLAVHAGSIATVFSTVDGKVLTEIKGEDARFDSAYWCGEERIVSFSEIIPNNDIVVWRTKDQSVIARTKVVKLNDLRVSHDNSTLAIASSSGAYIWNIDSNTKVDLTNVPCSNLVVDGNRAILVATASSEVKDATDPVEPQQDIGQPKLMIVDTISKELFSEITLDFQPRALSLQRERGRLIVSGESLGSEVIELETGTVKSFFGGHAKNLIFAAFTSTTGSACTVSTGGSIRIHNLQEKATLLGQHAARVTSVAISPDRTQLLTGDSAGILKHWDLVNQKELKLLAGEGEAISQTSVASDNIHLLSVTNDGQVKIWDLRTAGFKVMEFEKPVLEAHLSPDGRKILALLGERRVAVAPNFFGTKSDRAIPNVIIMDIASKAISTLMVDNACVKADFSSKGSFIGILDSLGRVNLFSGDSYELRMVIPSKWMTDFQFISNESQILTTSERGSFLWDTKTGSRLGQSTDSQAFVSLGIANRQSWSTESPGGKWRLLVDKEIVKIPVDILAYAKEIAPRELSADEISQYQFVESQATDN